MSDIRWGVLGAARIARKQVIPAMRRVGAGEVVAVASASGNAEPFAAELGIARAYASYDELLADPQVDAVYIALPNVHHARWILAAARAGKHVLCEKPVVLGTAELEAVTAACADAGVQLAEAFMYRHHPQLRRLRELLDAGTIGELVSVESSFHFTLPRSEPPDIRLRPDLGGGSLRDIGCYPVDLLGWLTGAEPDDLGVVAHRDTPDGADTRMAVAARYGAVTANLHFSFDAPFRAEARLIGTAGSIELPDVFRADNRGGTARIRIDRDGETSVVEVEGDQYGEQAAAFARRVTDGAEDADGAALTARTAATLERIAAAAGLTVPASL
ncbi:Gfo/Idh/MocA family oxidoreductase [Georgenia sp. EYE_87]|uniref:Gfo/Idh/MocA family protein n=1 Tax=Georgenia sp. EYE_87 TaxID=2853448 RepID=UPI002005B1AF|nr:Gfo/Idh/MocA family oxidoreductase [Georgenia sp. EYE_87]MCK6208988.1 Gfo/Idh/MocA family oxidoreductase [Georgenia sp. EYE_87]